MGAIETFSAPIRSLSVSLFLVGVGNKGILNGCPPRPSPRPPPPKQKRTECLHYGMLHLGLLSERGAGPSGRKGERRAWDKAKKRAPRAACRFIRTRNGCRCLQAPEKMGGRNCSYPREPKTAMLSGVQGVPCPQPSVPKRKRQRPHEEIRTWRFGSCLI